MQKRVKGRKFSRKRGPRRALIVSVVRALVRKEKIQTTEARAKEISPVVERLITKAKRNDLSTRRELQRYFSPELVRKMVEEIGPRFRERRGGYTRVVKLGSRKSDGARMALVEFVQ